MRERKRNADCPIRPDFTSARTSIPLTQDMLEETGRNLDFDQIVALTADMPLLKAALKDFEISTLWTLHICPSKASCPYLHDAWHKAEAPVRIAQGKKRPEEAASAAHTDNDQESIPNTDASTWNKNILPSLSYSHEMDQCATGQ